MKVPLSDLHKTSYFVFQLSVVLWIVCLRIRKLTIHEIHEPMRDLGCSHWSAWRWLVTFCPKPLFDKWTSNTKLIRSN
jgi:hypothetical protein